MPQQQVLVIGEHGRDTKQLPDAARDRFRFTYCAGDNQNTDLSPAGQFDWVLVDGRLMGGEHTDVFQSLRAIGFLVSDQSCASNKGCRVEWTPDGVLELHCCMQGGRDRNRGQATGHRDALDSFVFEYHAPMKKTG